MVSNAVAFQSAPATPSYADTVNSKYNQSSSLYVNISTRINEAISKLPLNIQASIRGNLIAATTQWSKRHPLKKTWADLDLCDAASVPLSTILIDTTLQRELDLNWIYQILMNWRDIQAQPIQVYKPVEDFDELCNRFGIDQAWASWDGQHTAVSLYLIAVWLFKLDPATVMVPVVKYKASSKAEMRLNFIKGNSKEGKHLLDEIDLFMQRVYGVRIDGVTDALWVDAELKQQYLEAAGLFATNAKFNDCHMPGAISRMKELTAHSPAVIKDFCTYAKVVQAYRPRPVDTMEIDLMTGWFDMARKGGIFYTDQEIQDLATHLQMLFGADFSDVGPFWSQAREAYTNWWDGYYSDPTTRPDKMVFKMLWSHGAPFLYYQLRKTWNGRIPKLTVNSAFIPYQSDLF